MRIIPGSHQHGPFRHTTDLSNALTLNQVADTSQFDENTAQYIELQPGQVSLHDIGVLHGSAANTSGRRRTGLALRYMPSTAWFRRDASVENSKLDWTLLPLQLVRGVNRDELNDLRVGLTGTSIHSLRLPRSESLAPELHYSFSSTVAT